MQEFFEEIVVPSSLDGSLEPSLLFLPENPEVLVVGLHTWSADRFNQMKAMLPPCQERGWALLLPEFRGPNLDTNPRAPEAGGSALARRDIVDATEWVIRERFASRPETFLLGGSGGGHMSLMVAAREEFSWSAVSSWCPITNIASWHGENAGYAPHIEALCGGSPMRSSEIDAQYRERSPIHYAAGLRSVRLQLAHGRDDASVPFSHSWRLAQELIGAAEFYLSIFDGKHELRAADAFAFFDRSLQGAARVQLTG